MRSRGSWTATVTMALAACGLAPAPSPSAPIAGDGVAAFGDSSPIELCVGKAHVVSPSVATGAGFVCVRAGAVPVTCTSDNACSGIERCVCGRCIVRGCNDGTSCGTGLVCSGLRCTTACVVDTDCAAEEVCNVGGCARPCTSDVVCHYGERCDGLNNVCVTNLCSPTTPCAPGDTCEGETVAGDLHEPEVVSIGGAAVAYIEVRASGPGTGVIYRASIDAPGRWTANPATPVLAQSGGQATGAPSIVADASGVEMYFALGDGAGIGHAVSADGGLTFVADAVPMLVPAAAWEQGFVGSPAAVRFQGATLLFYEGGPGSGVGLARIGPSGAVRVGDGLVISPAAVESPLFWHDVSAVGTPYALVAGDILRVYFTGRGVFGSDAIQADAAIPADVTDSVGLAASLDGATFTLYPTGPVYARITNLREYLGEREAAVRLLPGGGATMTFVATDASGTVQSGLAGATE